MEALLREPGDGGSYPKGPEGYERKALGIGISLHGGSVGQPGVGSSTHLLSTCVYITSMSKNPLILLHNHL